MSENEPLVSIGLIVFNGAQYLAESLDSLISQDYPNFEIVISDNASEDATPQICREYQKKDSRIRYYRNPTNIGRENGTRAFELAKGQFFMWAAHDDLWARNYVSALAEALLVNPDCVLAYGAVCAIDERGNRFREYPEVLKLSKNGALFYRLRKYIWSEESEGKPNLFYGLWRASAVEKVKRQYGLFLDHGCYGDWGTDNVFVFSMAIEGEFVAAPHTTFLRRVYADRTYADPDLICHIHEMQGYFHKYRKVIEQRIPPSEERDLLLASISVREVTWYQRIIDRMSSGEGKKLIHGLLTHYPVEVVRSQIGR